MKHVLRLFVSHYDEKYAFCVFCFTLWWKIRILRILFHTMMKNGVCSMVSDTKLCNNVANYGTNIYIWNGPKKEKKSSLLKLFFILHFRLFHINFSNFWESTFQFPKKRWSRLFTIFGLFNRWELAIVVTWYFKHFSISLKKMIYQKRKCNFFFFFTIFGLFRRLDLAYDVVTWHFQYLTFLS